MNILATGGAGYVGSHCVRRLVAGGHRVVVYDNLSSGHAGAVPAGTVLIRGDLADEAALDAALAGIDTVMHFAAHLDVGESVREPLKYYANNLAGTVVLLRRMQARGVRRLVFSSTCATYGIPKDVPITEDAAQAPISPYGRSKLAVEWMLRDCAAAWGLGACALRYFNACGAAADGAIGEDHDPEIHLIPLVLQVAAGRRAHIDIYGTDYPTPDGTCIRDYIHVEDLGEAHLRAAEALVDGRFDAYNLGTGQGVSVREIIDAAQRVTGCAIATREVDRRAGDPPELFADAGRIRAALGWSPRYTRIDDVIATAWAWHRAHPEGFGD